MDVGYVFCLGLYVDCWHDFEMCFRENAVLNARFHMLGCVFKLIHFYVGNVVI